MASAMVPAMSSPFIVTTMPLISVISRVEERNLAV